MTKPIKKYLRDCKKIFPFFGKNEKIFISRLQNNLYDYYNENTAITYNEIVEHFGKPKEIMISYINNYNNDALIKKMRIKQILRNAFITIVAILIVGLSTIIIMEQITISEIQNQEIITEEITIH